MKKQKLILPEVQILGDLKDVKSLVSAINKKKVLVVFQDGDQETFYLEIEGKLKQILKKDITKLEKKFSMVYFSFFPSRKKTEPLAKETPQVPKQEKKVKKEKKEKKEIKAKKKS